MYKAVCQQRTTASYFAMHLMLPKEDSGTGTSYFLRSMLIKEKEDYHFPKFDYRLFFAAAAAAAAAALSLSPFPCSIIFGLMTSRTEE